MGFNRRYDPGHFAIKNDLDLGKIGRLEKIIITSRDPSPPSKLYLKSSGGIFRDMMIHDFDLCRFYLKRDEITEITAAAASFDSMYRKIDDHELATVTMKSKKGVLCIITNSKQTFLNFFIDRYEEAYKLQLYDLIMLHKKKISPRSTYSDGLSALQIANAAYKSLKLKKVIKLK